MLVVDTHPSQYSAPFYRAFNRAYKGEMTVLFFSDFSNGKFRDSEFGKEITWEEDLLAGYKNIVIEKNYQRSYISLFSPFISFRFFYFILTYKGEKKFLLTGWNNINLIIFAFLSRFFKWDVNIRAESFDKFSRKRFTFIRHFILRICFKKIHKFFYIGTRSKSFYLKTLSVSDEQLAPSLYGVDNQRFSCPVKRSAAPTEGLRILFVSKLSARKRVIDLILGFYHSSLRFDETSIVTIVGDGAERGYAETLVKRMGISHRVRFVGFVNQKDLGFYYCDHDVFVLPSEFDTWGLVVNEAMAAGCAILVSEDCGCSCDLVASGEPNGFVFPTGDIRQISDYLGRYDDRSLLTQHRANSLKKIKKFDAGFVGEQLARYMSEES
jgi:glycosyltransferase involved in cell wall biosynthesis